MVFISFQTKPIDLFMNPIETFWIWANRSRSYETPPSDDMNYAVFEQLFVLKMNMNWTFWAVFQINRSKTAQTAHFEARFWA